MFIHLVFSSIVCQTPFNITSLLAKEQIYEKGIITEAVSPPLMSSGAVLTPCLL